jgi:hypothetical protein
MSYSGKIQFGHLSGESQKHNIVQTGILLLATVNMLQIIIITASSPPSSSWEEHVI